MLHLRLLFCIMGNCHWILFWVVGTIAHHRLCDYSPANVFRYMIGFAMLLRVSYIMYDFCACARNDGNNHRCGPCTYSDAFSGLRWIALYLASEMKCLDLFTSSQQSWAPVLDTQKQGW